MERAYLFGATHRHAAQMGRTILARHSFHLFWPRLLSRAQKTVGIVARRWRSRRQRLGWRQCCHGRHWSVKTSKGWRWRWRWRRGWRRSVWHWCHGCSCRGSHRSVVISSWRRCHGCALCCQAIGGGGGGAGGQDVGLRCQRCRFTTTPWAVRRRRATTGLDLDHAADKGHTRTHARTAGAAART